MLSPMVREQLLDAAKRGMLDVQVAERTANRIEKTETAYLHSGIYPDRFFWAANTICEYDPEFFDSLSQKELIALAKKLIKEEWDNGKEEWIRNKEEWNRIKETWKTQGRRVA